MCPEGWELPTEADWMAMAQELGGTAEEEYGTIKGIAAKVMGNAYFNDQLMWEYWPAVGAITNESGLAMIPAGYSMLGVAEDDAQESIFYDNRYPQAIFKGRNEYAVFWTADKVADEEGMAYYRYLICDQPDLMISKGDVRSFGASVRCVRSTAE